MLKKQFLSPSDCTARDSLRSGEMVQCVNIFNVVNRLVEEIRKYLMQNITAALYQHSGCVVSIFSSRSYPANTKTLDMNKK